jgi:hypothetical protein
MGEKARPPSDDGKDLTQFCTDEQALSHFVDRVQAVYAALSLAPVSHERGGVVGTPDLDGGEAYLHRELGAVAVSPRELTPDTHVACSWGAEEIPQVT